MSSFKQSSDTPNKDALSQSGSKRALCSSCSMLLTHCLCDVISPMNSKVRLVILQHPQEAKHHKNTAKLLALNIPNTQVVIGELFEPSEIEALQGLHQDNTLLLYPGEDSLELGKSSICDHFNEPSESLTLVVIDSSWKKSKKMFMVNQWLHTFHSFHLKLDDSPSIYQIRKKRQEYFRSTLEASVIALNILEDYPIEPSYQLLDRFCELKLKDIHINNPNQKSN